MLPALKPASRAIARRLTRHLRAYSTPPPAPRAGPSKPYRHEKAPPPPQAWLTRQLKQSPMAMRVFMKLFGALGYSSPKQIAARRALAMYEQLCARRAEEEKEFWSRDCYLPPTFQTWFTITNLHVWMLTTRLRALPAPHGQLHIQGLIDHFFLDVEDRIRLVLQPQALPAAPAPAPTDAPSADTPKPTRRRAPEALVTKQMKIFREQWAGLGMAFDLALVRDDVADTEMAGAIWRNLLGARGAQGIAYPDASAPASSAADAEASQGFRRSINPAGEIEKYGKFTPSALKREEARDDGSGVHDFEPAHADRYVAFPTTMAVLVAYVRREVARLARVEDAVILRGGDEIGKERSGVEQLKFGKIGTVEAELQDVLNA
ncbi:hypothetical protein FA95DRAFT_1561176 [Auriscalpium vulgare]|uniref:Uncharacterized protein n=1 Tax=Auriscalpium vulgare TaxID=40419 RepID=A0ACB8RP38_9AGAM|nr:hypothetical protein FA95DRAFT_1561176 [Auriscalpium vulgare]